jgi:hypothetical protein
MGFVSSDATENMVCRIISLRVRDLMEYPSVFLRGGIVGNSSPGRPVMVKWARPLVHSVMLEASVFMVM